MKMNTHALMSTAMSVLFIGTAYGRPDLITNGSFELGFNGWTRADQIGSDGTFQDQTGTISPINGLVVQAPPDGLHAAMTDATGPGSHVLYQDIFIPAGSTGGTLAFSYFVNNTAAAFTTPATLDFATPALNQQARVDFLHVSADPFSTNTADVMQNVFQTLVGSALVTGYNVVTVDVTSLILEHAGETLRLRFAETDNVNIFNFGVDAVSLNVIPAPPVILLGATALFLKRRTRR